MSGNSSISVNNSLQVIESITQFLNGTQAVWNDITLPIPQGMVVYATDTTVVKIGDGVNLYGNLPTAFVFSEITNFVVNYNNVEGLITAALAAVVAQPNPYTQYALKTSLSKSAIASDIVLYSPDAIVPPSMSGTVNLKSSTILKSSTLCHISQSSYCSQSGYMTTTGALASTSSLVSAVPNTATSSTQPFTIFILSPGNYPTINYNFSKPRTLAEVLLFTEVQPNVACVTQASITAGGITQTVNITAGASGTVVTGNTIFTNVLVSSVSITVLQVSNSTLPYLSLGFNVIYGDTGAQDISISGDTVVSFNYNGQVITLSPTADLPVSMSSIVFGHEYILTLTTSDGLTLQPEILSIAPIRGDGNLTCKNEFSKLTSDSDAYYGTIVMAGVPVTTNWYQIYTTKNVIVPNSNVVNLTQTFVQATAIKNLNIKIPVTLASGQAYPTAIAVVVTQVGGNVITLNINPVYLSDGIFSTFDIFVDLSSYGSLIGFQINLTSGTGTTVALSIIDVILPCLSYDESKHLWSDGKYRTIVGTANKLANGVYQLTSQPAGNQTIIPVNDLLSLTFYQEYLVPNPFSTENITVTPFTLYGDFTAGISVQLITDDFITILCNATGAYILKVVLL